MNINLINLILKFSNINIHDNYFDDDYENNYYSVIYLFNLLNDKSYFYKHFIYYCEELNNFYVNFINSHKINKIYIHDINNIEKFDKIINNDQFIKNNLIWFINKNSKLNDFNIKNLINLKYFKLCYNKQITNEGIKNLVNLEYLYLEFNENITDEGIKYLINLEKAYLPKQKKK